MQDFEGRRGRRESTTRERPSLSPRRKQLGDVAAEDGREAVERVEGDCVLLSLDALNARSGNSRAHGELGLRETQDRASLAHSEGEAVHGRELGGSAARLPVRRPLLREGGGARVSRAPGGASLDEREEMRRALVHRGSETYEAFHRRVALAALESLNLTEVEVATFGELLGGRVVLVTPTPKHPGERSRPLRGLDGRRGSKLRGTSRARHSRSFDDHAAEATTRTSQPWHPWNTLTCRASGRIELFAR